MNINDIRNLRPCYDPTKYLPEDWQGTALDILRVEACPAQDRLWVVCHKGWIDNKILRLFAVWCAREALKLVEPDPRSINACDVAERYATGEATSEELAAARAAAWAAARDEFWDASRGAARVAAWAAARAAAAAAWGAAMAAAWDEFWGAEINHLVGLLEEE